MNRPPDWHLFQFECDLYEHLDSNLPYMNKECCKRGDRPRYDLKRCSWNVCPRLKKMRKFLKGKSANYEVGNVTKWRSCLNKGGRNADTELKEMK